MSDFVANYKHQIATLEANDAVSKAKNTLIGRYVTYSVADGYAYYVIRRVSKTVAFLEWQDIGDGYSVSAWGRPGRDGTVGVKLSIILPILRHRDTISSFVAKTDDWWANQTIGATVHYSNGFGEYVRGVIVQADGEKSMRPTALVGNWKSKWDLVTRRADGTVSYGYYPSKIKNGETFHPNASNMVEYPGFRLVGTHPSTLPEVNLSEPALSVEAQELARVETLRKQAVAILESIPSTPNDFATTYANTLKALDDARKVLARAI